MDRGEGQNDKRSHSISETKAKRQMSSHAVHSAVAAPAAIKADRLPSQPPSTDTALALTPAVPRYQAFIQRTTCSDTRPRSCTHAPRRRPRLQPSATQVPSFRPPRRKCCFPHCKLPHKYRPRQTPAQTLLSLKNCDHRSHQNIEHEFFQLQKSSNSKP